MAGEGCGVHLVDRNHLDSLSRSLLTVCPELDQQSRRVASAAACAGWSSVAGRLFDRQIEQLTERSIHLSRLLADVAGELRAHAARAAEVETAADVALHRSFGDVMGALLR